MSRIVLFGATSEIGGEIITRLASGNDLVLAARRPEALTELEDACRAAGASAVESIYFDAGDVDTQA
ncbi:MAG TPA: SDR family oxidoreductase, partial [Corynebacterium variabile]|nr:SDR family oxidoreductase [Corynebacterium variabile]